MLGLNRLTRIVQERCYRRYRADLARELSFTEAMVAFPDRNSFYVYMHHCLHHRCPQILRDHRIYFKQDQRGFGEDAFHAMWWLLLSEFLPVQLLEIGIYRGQTISLWALIGRCLRHPHEIHGISPFGPHGDSVSSYPNGLDYKADVLEAFRYWELDPPILVKGLSTDPESVMHIRSRVWDLVYIDGSHDYETVLADYQLCRDNLGIGGILVLDDASLGSTFRPPRFSFAGHPGPSRVAREHAAKEMRFLGAVGHNNVFLKI